MEESFYLELCSDPIRFDSVSQITDVFFDDSNKQVNHLPCIEPWQCAIFKQFHSINLQLFAVRSGGATGVTVKGPTENDTITFCMEDKGEMRSIKFSPDRRILGIQRGEKCVEFISFVGNQPNVNDIIVFQSKSTTIFGFVWVHNKEVVFISNTGLEIYTVNVDKKQLKSIKSMNLTTDWFSWCPAGNLAVLASNKGMLLTPFLLKQGGIITRLPKIECKSRSKRTNLS